MVNEASTSMIFQYNLSVCVEVILNENMCYQMLCRVEQLCKSADPAVVLIGENTSDGQFDSRRPYYWCDSTDTLLSCLRDISESHPAEKVDELITRLRTSRLILPRCYVRYELSNLKSLDVVDLFLDLVHDPLQVSRGAHEMVAMVDELLENVFEKIRSQDVDNGSGFHFSVLLFLSISTSSYFHFLVFQYLL